MVGVGVKVGFLFGKKLVMVSGKKVGKEVGILVGM